MQNRPDLHHIQRSIILNLASYSPQRFTELQPPRTANNTFSYHLKKLADSGYIQNTPSGYIATRKALKMVALNNQHRSGAPTPITMLYITNNNNEVLLVNRNTKPFQGWYGLPSGTIHAGESLSDAATRELFEKTTLTPRAPLKPSGTLDFQYREVLTDDLFVHALAFLYTYHIDNEEESRQIAQVTTKYGQLSWSKLGRAHILPEVKKAHDIIQGGLYHQLSVTFDEPNQVPSIALVETL